MFAITKESVQIKFWETEEDRDNGESAYLSLGELFNEDQEVSMETIIAKAEKLYFSSFAAVEVVSGEKEALIYLICDSDDDAKEPEVEDNSSSYTLISSDEKSLERMRIKVWKTKDDRNKAECDFIPLDPLVKDIDDAVAQVKDLYRNNAAVELVWKEDDEDEFVIYHISDGGEAHVEDNIAEFRKGEE